MLQGSISAEFVGIISYRVSQDSPNTFVGTWYSTLTSEPALGIGIGRGDTSKGFSGEHCISYYHPDGSLAGGPYDLRVVKTGEMRELTWWRGDTAIFKGIGIETADQLIASYWPVVPLADM